MPSTVINAFSYDAENRILKVVYVSGAVYNYMDVPETIYQALSKVKSKGTFLNKNIKGRFDYKKIYDP